MQRAALAAAPRLFEDHPYGWGWQCNDMAFKSYNDAGLLIPRDIGEMLESTHLPVIPASDARAGDLIFFYNKDDRAFHVALAAPNSSNAAGQATDMFTTHGDRIGKGTVLYDGTWQVKTVGDYVQGAAGFDSIKYFKPQRVEYRRYAP